MKSDSVFQSRTWDWGLRDGLVSTKSSCLQAWWLERMPTIHIVKEVKWPHTVLTPPMCPHTWTYHNYINSFLFLQKTWETGAHNRVPKPLERASSMPLFTDCLRWLLWEINIMQKKCQVTVCLKASLPVRKYKLQLFCGTLFDQKCRPYISILRMAVGGGSQSIKQVLFL